MLKKLFLVLAVILFLTACSPFRPSPRTSPEGDMPRTYSLFDAGDAEHSDKWWLDFDDPELNALIEEGLSGSFSLRSAWARLKQAGALAVQAGAELYPALSLTSSASYTRQRSDGSGSKSRETTNSEAYALGLAGSYELDLWGRIRSEQEAAVCEAAASREDLNTAAMTLAAEITARWLNILSQRMQKHLLEEQLETAKAYLDLIELRFGKGMVSALDVYQQRQVIEKIKAQFPLVETQEQLLKHELALLLGRFPQAAITITRESLPGLPSIPAAGLPADLLVARPDIRATGLRLQAADYNLAAARANRLPNISLSAVATYSSGALDTLFDFWLLNLAANLTGPVFDGNRRAAEVERTKAVTEENVAVYRNAVYTAIKEVEDALISEAGQKEHIEALLSETNVARHALEEARLRYFQGASDYLPVLNHLLSVQELEIELINKKTELLIARLNLYRALGGGWTDELSPPSS